MHISDDSQKVKSKNIDVISEYSKTEHKRAANFVVIGEFINKFDSKILTTLNQAMLMQAKVH